MKFSALTFSKIFVVALAAIAFAPAGTDASSSHNLSGYAWSSNIGWISFNCTNKSSCGTSDYGVHMNANGWLSGNEASSTPGYAWSPNIGWIQFGGLTGFPTGGGTYPHNARVVGNSLRGWARALSYGGGWDGWISLSGSSAPSYGPTLSSQAFTGYSWGSMVVGWMTWNPSTGSGVTVSGDPASFTIGANESLRIQLLSSGTADSEQKNISVEPNAAFMAAGNSVTITIQSSPTVASTTFMYSFNGGSNYYPAGDPLLTATIPKGSSPYYVTSVPFKVRISRSSDAASLTVPPATIVLLGTSGSLTATKTLTIFPVTFDPRYEEI